MRVFVAGATGVIGQYLVPSLVAAGHEVTGTTRSTARAAALQAAGATPVIVDGLDRRAVLDAVKAAQPDVIVHQMTALASMSSFRNFDKEFPAARPASTTSSMTTRPRCGSGCRTWPSASVPRRLCARPPGWAGCWPARSSSR
jgi:NADPH:quinone reductase-like Zn-dependent oxidoreductase